VIQHYALTDGWTLRCRSQRELPKIKVLRRFLVVASIGIQVRCKYKGQDSTEARAIEESCISKIGINTIYIIEITAPLVTKICVTLLESQIVRSFSYL
jgi:hypothetical protein